MSGTWLVPVTALRRNVGQRVEVHRAGSLGELTVAGSSVPVEAEVILDVVLTSLSGGIEVTGTVRAPWQGECRRCLGPVRSELEAEVRELYTPPGVDRDGGPDEETYELGPDHLDLLPLARDAVLLELPLAPLCRPDCAGLCPTCGADLNTSPCDCDTEVSDPRWAALDSLRTSDRAL
ncbi:MAG: DUF177 domain-containing protein [Acidimicrobiaceae bacterium]|nr:DUF177 domain-containing protein [Acidimicrobiaceae bacterium]